VRGTGCSATRATLICSFSKSSFWSCTSLFSLLPGCCSAIYPSFVRSPWGAHGTIYLSQHGGRIPCAIGGGVVPLCRGQAYAQRASRRVAQLHSKQRTTSSASTAQLPVAQTGRHLGDFAASCCLVLSGRCSYSGLRELRSTLPRYVHSSLLSSASTPPYQARPDRHPPNPPIPQPPALFPCVA
jgi:hypothetical protein